MSAVLLVVMVAVIATKSWFGDDRPVLSHDLVVGTWRTTADGELSFGADGTFRASRIPSSLLGDVMPQPAILSGSGDWRLTSAVNDSSNRLTQVALTFGTIDNRPFPSSARLRSESLEGRVALFSFIGDPDLGRRLVFVKD